MGEKQTTVARETGLVHIYMGCGKGKTSAAIGLAVRAAGSGLRVLIEQFMKTEDTGERRALSFIPGITLLPVPAQRRFSFQMSEEERKMAGAECRKDFRRTVAAACEEDFDILILDEALTALEKGFLDESALNDFLREKPEKLEVVLTGRKCPDGLIALADYVSNIGNGKHPYDRGLMARIGIEK